MHVKEKKMDRKEFENVALELQKIDNEEKTKNLEKRIKKQEKKLKASRFAYKLLIRTALASALLNICAFSLPSVILLSKATKNGEETLTKSEQQYIDVARTATSGLNHAGWTFMAGAAIAGMTSVSQFKKKKELESQLPEKESPFSEFEYFQNKNDMFK